VPNGGKKRRKNKMAGLLGNLNNFLNTPYRQIFGNAASLNNTQTVDNTALEEQYKNALEKLNAANANLGSIQAQGNGNPYKIVNNFDFDRWENIPTQVGLTQQDWHIINEAKAAKDKAPQRYKEVMEYYHIADNSDALKAAQDAQAEAQKAFDLISAQYNPASGANITNSPAIGWGQQAREAELNSINRAMNLGRIAQGAENARMSALSAHPLLSVR
jgi:hypothetical protein